MKLVTNPTAMQHLRRVASWTSKSRKTDWVNAHDDPKCMSTEETTPGPRVTFSLSSFRSSSSRRRRESHLFDGLLCVSYHYSTWLVLMAVFLNNVLSVDGILCVSYHSSTWLHSWLFFLMTSLELPCL